MAFGVGREPERRLQIRLELAHYLISLAAQSKPRASCSPPKEILSTIPRLCFKIANLLREADDPADALTTYQRVEHHRNSAPAHVLASLDAESQIVASMGQYKRAAQALTRYMTRLHQHPDAATPQKNQPSNSSWINISACCS